ncbi:MAG: CoA transferase [Actinomycetota bacterium]
MTSGRPSGPLAGYRIVDFSANMSGPYGTMILGDQGADVVKVESPEGDPLRSVGTSRSGISAYFANLNRSKRSVVINLSTAEGRELAQRLIDTADVVVQNFRPAVANRLGLTGLQLRAARPGLVCASVTGFGASGPYAGRPVYDHVIQAASGIAASQTDGHTGQPSLIRQGIVDKVTGHVLAQAITAALLQRSRTGMGCDLNVCMLDAAVAFLWPDGMMNHTIAEPDTELPSIANSFRLTRTRDGHVALTVLTSAQWKGLLKAVGYVDLAADQGTWTANERMQRGGTVMKEVARHLSALTSEEVVAMMADHDVPCAPVVALEDLVSHPQLRSNGTVEDVEHPVLGRIRQPRPVVDFDQGGAACRRPVPSLGEHTVEVLSEIGVAADEIESLLGHRIVVSSAKSTHQAPERTIR